MDIRRSRRFKKTFKKLDTQTQIKVFKQIQKLRSNPYLGKPMRYDRKGLRELYIKPYRLSYLIEGNTLIIDSLYHKDQQ